MSRQAREGEDGVLLENKEEAVSSHDVENGYRSTRKTMFLRRPLRSLKTMMILCNVSVMVLVGFTFYHWSKQYPSLPIPPNTGVPAAEISIPAETTAAETTLAASTSIASASISTSTTAIATTSATGAEPTSKVGSTIPPSDSFDLKKSGFSGAGAPTRRDYVFNITRQISTSDGVFKPMILVNGQSPGPLIEANTGDTIRVVVHNSIVDDTTTIHWHGIDQRNSTWMDGVYGISQCGIPPGESFTYEFAVPEQRGSFWYHSHVTGQYTDGLFGPLIIHDPEEMVPEVDEDRIIMIGDHYHRTQKELLGEYLGVASGRRRHSAMVGMEPSPANFVMNGRNVFACGGERSVQRLPDGEYTLAQCRRGSVFSTRLRRGQRARLRIISHSSNIPQWFSVDSHVLQIVEIDGVEVEPIWTTRVFLTPGQRYSVVLVAHQPQAGNYIMRATAAQRCSMVSFGSHLDNIHYEATGILSYDDVDATTPAIGEPWALDSLAHPEFGPEPWAGRTCEDLPFGLAKPRRAVDAFEIGERNRHHIPFQMKRDGSALRTYIGGTVFSPVTDNALLWKGTEKGSEDKSDEVFPEWHFRQNQHVFVSHDDGKSAQVAISALNMMTHPWHLHGQTFQIVGWGPGAFGAGTTVWNTKNPLRRDTVTVPGNTHIVVRIKADNPGIWPLHCHIQWHAEGGMFALVAQRLGALQTMIRSLDGGIPRKFCSSK